MAQNISMKANSKKGLARKGATKKVITFNINNGIAIDANQKVTGRRIFTKNITKTIDRFNAALNKYFPNITREEQLKAYKRERFVLKNPVIIQAFKAL